MTRRFIGSVLFIIFAAIFFPSASAAGETAESIVPENLALTIDAQLKGELKTLLDPLLDAGLQNKTEDRMGKIFLQALKDGKRFFAGLAGPETDGGIPSIFAALSLSDTDWETLIEGNTQESYGSSTIVSDKKYSTPAFLSKLGNLVLVSNSEGGTKHSIDLFNGKKSDSLANSVVYQKIAAKLLPNRLFGLSVNFDQVFVELEKNGLLQNPSKGPKGDVDLSNPLTDVIDLYRMYSAFGMSMAESESGYKINFAAAGNESKLREKGITFNPAGNFTPSLYKKFPNAKTIFYEEGFNPAKSWQVSKKSFSSSSNSPLNLDQMLQQVKSETGLELERIMNTFELGFGIAIQYDEKSPFPYLTFLADIGVDQNNPRAAMQEHEASELYGYLQSFFEKEAKKNRKAVKQVEQGNITKLAVDFTKLDENYEGPPLPPVVLTYGLTADHYFVISNYPEIEKPENRTGFAAVEFENFPALNGMSYINMRNVWGFIDSFIRWAEEINPSSENAPPLEFYQGYYGVLEKLYSWKSLLVTIQATEYEMTVDGAITMDDEKHETYEAFIAKLKSNDTDGDGKSDFEERFILHTSVSNADIDEDGVNDFDELKRGRNPHGEGQLFGDVKESDWYAEPVGNLWNQEVISGYDDQSFKPGKLVTRAEFTAMAVRAFETSTSNYLGFDISLRRGVNPFGDVSAQAWYADPIAKAFSSGWVKGKLDPQLGMIFRPNDPITRAEAITILTRASETLRGSKFTTPVDDPFKDVSRDQWFYKPVMNGYAHGIVQGKRPEEFRPLENLSRAEAAVLIFRTLKVDVESSSSKTDIPGTDLLKSLPLGLL